MTDTVTWRTSTFSGSSGECVAVAGTLTQVRDSKNPDVPLRTPDFTAFAQALKSGQFPSPTT